MKKIIILLLALLMSVCAAVKDAETQTEPSAEMTVTETSAPEKATETTPKENKTGIETPKAEMTVPSATEHTEQKPAPETTAVTAVEAPVESVTTEPPATAKALAETVKEEKTTKIPPTIETPPDGVTEPPKAEFDVNYWINFARAYALQIGLEIDPTAVDCWDNPTTANADCIYLERDLKIRLNRYANDEDITAVNVWAESLGNGNYLIYIAYA